MKYSDYGKWTARATAWIERYFSTLPDQPVRAQTSAGDIAARLPQSPPDAPVDMDVIMADFERIVPDGLTHWQHPRFFAYFPANAAPASMIAEQLTNAIAAQCMLWQTSPAATEIETVMVDWMRQALGLRDGFVGVIQDSASSATLSAVLTMRERALDFQGNTTGLSNTPRLRIYTSEQVHTSVDKAAWVAGIGQDNLVRIPTDKNHAMRADALQTAINADRAAGYTPAGLIMCTGGTSIGACDDLTPLIKIAKAEGLYTHLDAAWAGSAMICPELRHIWAGVDDCDSIVFNPHKWLGAQFDCSIQFLSDPSAQLKTMGIRPTYLQTQGADEVTNYNEWTVPLGRRFRALKIWFLIRAYGLDGLRTRIRNHIKWAEMLADKLRDEPDFTITTECQFSLFTFQYTPRGGDADSATAALLERINDDGRIYLTQTKHDGKFCIRFQAGQFDCTRDDVMLAHNVILELARG
ncbi:pyridoxal-dependent decarboxylase [Amylibacter ulvae]|uniref:Pyridoxal-dependent decarboxylase n=1 Tax=Paramylibacter ulvae TaxID=1651968 RepID=A0ABQ3CVN3_9RHOB|nr:pyridoxal-dependent decarboxylase [Amylibacter ulvae]GHA44580.1 pyridoxal-dependent decarboxylase [Amylibacter ulvae]